MYKEKKKKTKKTQPSMKQKHGDVNVGLLSLSHNKLGL